ncbi:hypothetical protein LV564_05115 [Komagataeibacter nataicola]|uniref:hypothetical protein n=1 Tax=Komagataeibacter nataicola TaxID=265960 RepID=UPI0023DD48CE|nr:hypothetical protein [Komagataeibacter nataicola]WEQ56468.1 hypothetical protein LV564_05115 [Komagataeibacter nataicola]
MTTGKPFPQLPAPYLEAAMMLLQEKIRCDSALILNDLSISTEDKREKISKIFVWNDLSADLSYFLHAVERGAEIFINDRTSEPYFED